MIHNGESNTLEEQLQQQQQEEVILEERETLHRELMYLLSNETPEIWNQLIHQLTTCVNLFDPTRINQSSSSSSLSENSQSISFSIPHVAKGIIQVEGYRIVSGKINIKTKQHKHTIETSIKRSDPYILHEIQRAHHLLNNALGELKKTRTDNLVHSSFATVNNLILILEEVMAAIQQAREQVAVTDTDNLPMDDGSSSSIMGAVAASTQTANAMDDDLSSQDSSVSIGELSSISTSTGSIASLASSQQQQQQQQQNLSHAITMMKCHNTANPEVIPVQQSFYPALPRDIVVQFGICEDAKINIAIYSIYFTSATSASNRGELQQPNKPWFISSKPGEVALISEEYSTSCVLNHVSTALLYMSAAFRQCVRLRDKFSIHRSYFC
jgi:hypothetical protein